MFKHFQREEYNFFKVISTHYKMNYVILLSAVTIVPNATFIS